ncbi:nuclear transport factor 2 family protein [Roseibacterium sp. SDUM158017]|uniref:nuclear transport factor 2 family protein n=1 Tax=Roseicyclus salinarum TaxID=3036773 RepID=UPI0024151A6D|nr:nuclear transport factor 2 family protein [Roseibacterium sp. SDUM158017]MDG4649097.1 nuclear transport factor 2 family protein [Roseibacterium sp. SDUM158017]
MTQTHTPSEEAVRALAVAYCEGIHHADAQTFVEMCHDRFNMTAVEPGGNLLYWDKPAYLARVAGRKAFAGEPSYEILSVDTAGDEIARVHLWVDVPPRRFEDHLGFVRENGAWKLLTKVFRTMDGPAIEG